jgi:adiponectin receptor
MHSPYITYGYRVDYNYTQCVASLFTLHNETMNVWSHLIGFLSFIGAGFCIMVELQPHEVPLFARAATASYIVGAGCCLLFSTIYHLFGCMSTTHQKLLLMLDLGGVALLVGSSFLVWISFGKYSQCS